MFSDIFMELLDMGRYSSSAGVTLLEYIDLDREGSAVERKSTSRYCFNMVSTMIYWSHQNKSNVALSTAEAKYIEACSAGREFVWLWKLFTYVFGDVLEMTVIHCDNESCVNFLEKPVFYDRLNHIEMRYHFIQEMF